MTSRTSCTEREATVTARPGITCTKPEGAFYAYPNISSFLGRGGLKSASDVAGRLLREAHVATVPGEGFGTSEHIRVSYATSKAELDRGLERMRKFFAALIHVAAAGEFFEEQFFRPAIEWADEHGLTFPLSALVIYDSFIHSGSILRKLRAQFREPVPSQGGDERTWTQSYVEARHRWLAGHKRKPLRNTTYRMRCFETEIRRHNWYLDLRPIRANGVKVDRA